MIDVHQKYVSKFKEIGVPILKQYGFDFEVFDVCGTSASTKILIFKTLEPKYILTFATNHLDYADGVRVFKTDSREIQWDYNHLVLPKPPINESTHYSYMGNNLDNDIRKIVTDIINLE